MEFNPFNWEENWGLEGKWLVHAEQAEPREAGLHLVLSPLQASQRQGE